VLGKRSLWSVADGGFHDWSICPKVIINVYFLFSLSASNAEAQFLLSVLVHLTNLTCACYVASSMFFKNSNRLHT
jgi:hypothetical protein